MRHENCEMPCGDCNLAEAGLSGRRLHHIAFRIVGPPVHQAHWRKANALNAFNDTLHIDVSSVSLPPPILATFGAISLHQREDVVALDVMPQRVLDSLRWRLERGSLLCAEKIEGARESRAQQAIQAGILQGIQDHDWQCS